MTKRQGRKVLVGRFSLMDNHLRAGMFVVERALGELKLPQRKVCYILDLGEISDDHGEKNNEMNNGGSGSGE